MVAMHENEEAKWHSCASLEYLISSFLAFSPPQREKWWELHFVTLYKEAKGQMFFRGVSPVLSASGFSVLNLMCLAPPFSGGTSAEVTLVVVLSLSQNQA